MDVFRPDQITPAEKFFLAGSYTKQDYIDSMWALLLPCYEWEDLQEFAMRLLFRKD